jgi:hypothetical protein
MITACFFAQVPAPMPGLNQVYLDLTNLSNIPDPLASVADAILAIAYHCCPKQR